MPVQSELKNEIFLLIQNSDNSENSLKYLKNVFIPRIKSIVQQHNISVHEFDNKYELIKLLYESFFTEKIYFEQIQLCNSNILIVLNDIIPSLKYFVDWFVKSKL